MRETPRLLRFEKARVLEREVEDRALGTPQDDAPPERWAASKTRAAGPSSGSTTRPLAGMRRCFISVESLTDAGARSMAFLSLPSLRAGDADRRTRDDGRCRGAGRTPGAREAAHLKLRPSPFVLFLLLTFVPAWALWIGAGVLSRTGAYRADAAWLAAQLGVFAPALSAFVVASLTRPGSGRRAARLAGFLYLPALALGAAIATHGFDDLRRVDDAWLLPVSLLALAALLLLGRRGSRVEPWPLGDAGRGTVAIWTVGAALLPVSVYAAAWAAGGTPVPASAIPAALPHRDLTVAAALLALGWNLVFGGSLGEEPGWRGFLLPRLLSDRSPFGASLVVGFWWALWHAPIDWIQGFVLSGPGALVARQLWTLPLAVLFTWVTVRAGGSLLPALALHATLNTITDFALADPARYASATAVFWVATLIAAAAAVSFDPVLLRRPDEVAAPAPGPPAGSPSRPA